MPTVEKITRPEQLVEYFAQLLKDNMEPLDLAYIAKYGENLIPRYPGVLVQPGEFKKEVHGTHTFLHTLQANFWIMHANLAVDRRTRSLEDCQLATKVIDVLESSRSLGGRIIYGMVETERFAALPPQGTKNDGIVSTQLIWGGIVESRF